MDFEREMEALRPAMLRLAGAKLSQAGVRDGAEDVVQAAYVAAWERLHRFDTKTGASGLKAWIRQIVEFKVCDWISTSRRREKWVEPTSYGEEQTDALEQVPALDDVAQTALDKIEREDERERLYELIAGCDTLTQHELHALMLRVSSDLSHKEVSGIMGVSEEASRVLNHRATIKLKLRYSKLEER